MHQQREQVPYFILLLMIMLYRETSNSEGYQDVANINEKVAQEIYKSVTLYISEKSYNLVLFSIQNINTDLTRRLVI